MCVEHPKLYVLRWTAYERVSEEDQRLQPCFLPLALEQPHDDCSDVDVLNRLENRLARDAGLTLVRRPAAPKDVFRLSVGRIEPEWERYL